MNLLDLIGKAALATRSSVLGHYALAVGEELNRRLEILLKAFLLHDRKLFDEPGPLCTFFSRIEMAAALGLITSDEHEDLNLIRKIRNHIAHHALDALGRDFSFEDEKTRSRCDRLKT